MEPERKRKTDDAESGTAESKKTKSTEAEEEEEVEEFFAILRRIHAAVKYFDKADWRRRPELLSAAANTWKPSFEVQDFVELKGRSGLDLNSEPTTERYRG